jgi:hypothetical protein
MPAQAGIQVGWGADARRKWIPLSRNDVVTPCKISSPVVPRFEMLHSHCTAAGIVEPYGRKRQAIVFNQVERSK